MKNLNKKRKEALKEAFSCAKGDAELFEDCLKIQGYAIVRKEVLHDVVQLVKRLMREKKK